MDSALKVLLIVFILGKLMILLRDGRTLIGYLRSVDQFANLVLHKAIGKCSQDVYRRWDWFDWILERIHVGDKYGDMERGIFIIRGENVVLLGEIVSWKMFLCNLVDDRTIFAKYYKKPLITGFWKFQASFSVPRRRWPLRNVVIPFNSTNEL